MSEGRPNGIIAFKTDVAHCDWAGGFAAPAFVEGNYVALGFNEVGNTIGTLSAEAMLDQYRAARPDYSERQLSVRANIMWRFLATVQPGDDVITYDPATRRYHLGSIAGPVTWAGETVEDLPNRRAVAWRGIVERDKLSPSARNSLGAIQTMILVPAAVADEIRALAAGQAATPVDAAIADPADELPTDVADAFAGIQQQALERIKDRIVKLDWEAMQELVAALLRAMGYKTSIAARGPDRGRDILATPDGFGFRAPRIIVEVKHRPGQTMGAPDVRAMPVGRQVDDRGLFVSTGGFTREAYYEAEHGKVPIALVNLDDLTRAIIDAYPNVDDVGRALLPLQRMYWPVG